jgi:hypothetical protein
MNPEFETILEDCLARLRAGESLEQCLAHYPAQAERLTPLLLAASRVHRLAVPQPRAQAVLAGRERVLAAMRAQNPVKAVSKSPVSLGQLGRYLGQVSTIFPKKAPEKENIMKFALRLALNVLAVSLIGGVLAVSASSSALPGDPLYAAKRAWEGARLTFTLDPQASQALQAQLRAERLQEVQSLIQLGRAETVEFEAGLQAMNASRWMVGNLPLEIQPVTVIEGTLEVGQMVWVRAQVQANGTVMALTMRPSSQMQDGAPAMMATQTAPGMMNTQGTRTMMTTQTAPGMMNTQRAPGLMTTQTAPGMMKSPVAPGLMNTSVAPGGMHTQAAPSMMNTPAAPHVVSTQVPPAMINTQPAPGMMKTQGAPSKMNPPSGPGSGPGMGPGKRP